MRRLYTLLYILITSMTSSIAQTDITLPEGWEPGSVTNLQTELIEKNGKTGIHISFNAPTEMTHYSSALAGYEKAELPGITRVEIWRSVYDQYNFIRINSKTDVTPGQLVEYDDMGRDFGRYQYRITIYAGTTKSNDWNWDNIVTATVGQVPANFADNAVQATADGTNVVFRLTAPTEDITGKPLTMPMYITLRELKTTGMVPQPVDVAVMKNNVMAGETVEYKLEKVANGSHTYMVSASTDAGSNSEYYLGVFIGTDLPGYVTKPVASIADGGVRITWQAPVSGQQGGNFGNPSELTYTIGRTTIATAEGQVLAEGLTTPEYFDTVDPASETNYYYTIWATNSVGTGASINTNGVLMGPASQLPYKESFNGEGGNTYDHSVTTLRSTGVYCPYNCGKELLIDGMPAPITPHSGAGMLYGMLYSMQHNETDLIQTGHIDLTSAENPAASLWIFNIPGYATGVSISIAYSLDEGQTYHRAATFHCGKSEETGWQRLDADLSPLKGKVVRLAIMSVTAEEGIGCTVVDDFSVVDDATVGIVTPQTTVRTTGIYSITGQRQQQMHKGVNIVNGKKVVK